MRLKRRIHIVRFASNEEERMAKKLYVAQVGLTVIRQVEFEADESLTDDEVDEIAGKLAAKMVGGCDEYQILQVSYRGTVWP